jgi:hypothetical protein
MVVLDVGCGQNKRGDVGIDIKKVEGVDVVCDAAHLPFKDKIFHKTLCYCVLEHLSNPYIALKEVYRVTNGVIIVRYDKFFSIYNFIGRGHKNLMIKERFVRLPKVFFVILNRLCEIKPIRFSLRKARIFEAKTYEKQYTSF